MKMPNADRYKTVSLKTTDLDGARERAFDHDADIRFRLRHDVPAFNHPFREVEYLLTQEGRARRGEISAPRPKNSVPSSKAFYTGMQVQHRYIVSSTNAGAAIRHGDGRTAQDATSATAFVKVRPT
jgi:hypothetical protein